MEEKCTSDHDDEIFSDKESSLDDSKDEVTEEKTSYYRSMTKHKPLFDLMMKIYAPYITPE